MVSLKIKLITFFVAEEGFPDSSFGKESACNGGDPSLIPGLERSSGEGIGYPLQYSWTSIAAQQVNNLLAMRETWVRSLGWEDPLEKGKATHSSMKRQKDRTLKDELPRSVGAQYATGDQCRNNSRKNEGVEPKQNNNQLWV